MKIKLSKQNFNDIKSKPIKILVKLKLSLLNLRLN